jgi:hypothetical protein
VQLRIHVWKSYHGPVPAGWCITQADGDRDNVRLENLALITRAENMRRNTIHNLPPEVKETIITLKKFKNVIKQHEKQNN